MGSNQSRGAPSEFGNSIENEHCKDEYKFKAFQFERIDHGDNQIWPKARSGHRTVSNHHNVYTYGGYNPDLSDDPDLRADENWTRSKPLFRELWKFNMATSCWCKVPATNIPYILASNAVLLQGNILLVYGGTGMPFGGFSSNSLYVCNLKEAEPEFRQVTTIGDIPAAQYGQAVFTHDNFLYTIGGTTGYDYSSDVHRLNLATKQWEVIYLNRGLPNEPTGRYRHEIGLQLHKYKVFIFGGGNSMESYGFKSVPVFDFARKEWITVETYGDANVQENNGYPLPRRFHSLVQPKEGADVFITGGDTGMSALADTWKINLETLMWTRIDSMRLTVHRYFHAATVSPHGKMYLFGGTNAVTRTDEMLTAWLCIPKLEEICWEALLYYNLLDRLSTETIKQILPPDFFRRLH